MNTVRTRFAPSPTGFMHEGHMFAAKFSYEYARARGGDFILRIEDIDPVRCKAEYTDAIFKALKEIGLRWEEPVRIQSQHYNDYKKAINVLKEKGVLYPCFCSRKEIRDEVNRAGYAPHGPEGLLYPRTCKTLSKDTQFDKMRSDEDYALRLDLSAALKIIDPETLFWDEGDKTYKADPELLGDIVIARKDIGTSYHLSVVVDDAIQNITHVTRGEELRHNTHIQRVLQELLGYNRPHYVHHPVLKDDHGHKISKRDTLGT